MDSARVASPTPTKRLLGEMGIRIASHPFKTPKRWQQNVRLPHQDRNQTSTGAPCNAKFTRDRVPLTMGNHPLEPPPTRLRQSMRRMSETCL